MIIFVYNSCAEKSLNARGMKVGLTFRQFFIAKLPSRLSYEKIYFLIAFGLASVKLEFFFLRASAMRKLFSHCLRLGVSS